MTTSNRFRRWIPRTFIAFLFVQIVLSNSGGNLPHADGQNSVPYVEQVPVPKYAQAIEDGRALLQTLVESSKVSGLLIRPDLTFSRKSIGEPYDQRTSKAIRPWKPSRPPG